MQARRDRRRDARIDRWVRAITLLGVLVIGGSGIVSCSTTVASPSPTTWRQVDLPADQAPVTLTAYPGGVLIGTQSRAAGAAPGLLRLEGSTTAVLPVRPVTPYAKQATWLSIAPEADGRLVAIAGARGGAHSNVRWSVWRGDLETGLAEQEQAFSTFGGWGAGEQLGVLTPTTGPLLLGSWESHGAGLDADIWTPQGVAWVRQDPTGSVLASTTGELVGPRSGSALGPRAVVVGSLVTLGDGVHQSPAVWRSTTGNAGWDRTALPMSGRTGEAISVGCSAAAGSCLVVGVVDGRVAGWELTDGDPPTATARSGIPVVELSDRVTIPAPMWGAGTWTVLLPSGTGTVALRASGDAWETRSGPPGAVTAAIRTATGQVYAVTTDGVGLSQLWTTDDPSPTDAEAGR